MDAARRFDLFDLFWVIKDRGVFQPPTSHLCWLVHVVQIDCTILITYLHGISDGFWSMHPGVGHMRGIPVWDQDPQSRMRIQDTQKIFMNTGRKYFIGKPWDNKKNHPDLDPTDLGLVFGILIYPDIWEIPLSSINGNPIPAMWLLTRRYSSVICARLLWNIIIFKWSMNELNGAWSSISWLFFSVYTLGPLKTNILTRVIDHWP